jgi:serine/threonine protein kinase
VTVGPYRIVNRIGEGGMGVVHLALDAEGRAVAIKILRPHVASDEDARRRLGREVDTLRRLRDPRVAEVLDADVDGQLPYLVTRFVPGRPLERLVRQDGPLSVGATAQLGRDLAGALRAIHAAGVVHRDVKPANVMILDGAPVLIDFGIAHVVDESRLTVAGLVMGTPGYLSPELCDGEPVSEATDWWGWGATLAFAATGRAPFGTGPVEVVLDRVRRGAADLDGVPEPMRSALGSALAVDPAARPPADLLLAGLLPSLEDPHSAVTHVIGSNAPAGPTEVFASSARTTTYATPPIPAQTPAPHPPGYLVAPEALSGPASVASPGAQIASGSHPGPARTGTPDAATGRPPTPGAAPSPSGASPPATPTVPPAQAPGPPRRPAVPRPVSIAVALLVAVSAVAAVAPGVAVVAAVVGVIALRTLDRTLALYWRRRYQRGPRRGDRAVAVLLSPWEFVSAALLSLPTLLLPLAIGLSVVFLTGLLTRNGHAIGPDSSLALAAGMAAALVTVWVAPGGFSIRRAFGEVVKVLVPTQRAHRIALAVCGLVTVSATIVALQGVRDETFLDLLRTWIPGV